MSIRRPFLTISLLLTLAGAVAAGGKSEALARQAVSEDEMQAGAAVVELRRMGQAGLDALFRVHADQIAQFKRTGKADAGWQRIAAAIDTVAMQKDAYASGLYWFTDLDQAKRTANARNKPILSLRMLGDLNEEFSCANSRLFRSLLYANSEISGYLRENFVLHWRSVRPAPRITVDFGDGRRIERTVTGNSIHYILHEDGTIIDALPGLYSPRAFKLYLEQAHDVYKRVDELNKNPRNLALARFRSMAASHLRETRKKAFDLAKVSLTDPATGTDALSIAPFAMAKMVTEVTLLRVYDPQARFIPSLNFDDWKRLSRLYEPESKIDEASIGFIRRQNPNLSEQEFQALLKNLNEYVSLDTTRNDFLFRMQIYSILNGEFEQDVEAVNDRVYTEVFKTPAADQWLGLYSSDVYMALDGQGVTR
jgi:hypothetical protein